MKKKNIAIVLLAVIAVLLLVFGCNRKSSPQAEAKVFDKAGTYSDQTSYGDVQIKSDGVILENATINGTLTIDAAVGDGTVKVRNSRIVKDTEINGGGANSVHFEKTALNKMNVNKKGVRIVLDKDSEADALNVIQPARLELAGQLQTLVIAQNGSGSVVTLAKEAKLQKATLNGKTEMTADGAIETLILGENAKDSSLTFNNKVNKLDLNAKVNLNFGDNAVVEKLIATDKAKDSSVTLAKGARINILATETTIALNGEGTVQTVITNREENLQGNSKPAEVQQSANPIKKSANGNDANLPAVTQQSTGTSTDSTSPNQDSTATTGTGGNQTPQPGQPTQPGQPQGPGPAPDPKPDPEPEPNPPAPVEVKVTGVHLDKETLTLTKGQEAQLKATVEPDNADNKAIDWYSQDDKIVSVDSEGKIKALEAGQSTITVITRDGGHKATCQVTVENAKPEPTPVVKVSSVTLDQSQLTMTVGDTAQLNAQVKPDNASDKTIAWYAENPDIASVDGSGKVTALAEGQTKITVVTKDGGHKAVCDVTVSKKAPTDIPVESVTIEKTAGSLAVGDTLQLSAVIKPDNATNKKVQWRSAAENIAAVSADGVVTAKAPGDAVITAVPENPSQPSVAASITLRVTAPIKRVTMSGSGKTVTVGEILSLSAVDPENAASGVGFSWQANGKEVGSGAAYTVGEGDIGKKLTLTLTGKDGGYYTGSATSEATKAVTANKSALTAALTAEIGEDHQHPAYRLKASDYQANTWQDYTGAVDAALRVEADPLATTEQVAGAIKGMDTAKGNLIFAGANKLEEMKNTAEAKTEGAYTAASWKAFQSAYEAAKAMPETSQEEIVAKIEAIRGAMDKLVLKTSVTAVNLTIEGDLPVVGRKVTATTVPENATVTYLWLRGDGTTFEPIPGETSAVYTLSADDLGKVLQLTVTGTGDYKDSPSARISGILDNKVTGVTLDQHTLELKIGQTQTLTATVTPDYAADKTVSYHSNDETVAKVDPDGKVTAVGRGTANITVTTTNGQKTDVCAVTVKEDMPQIALDNEKPKVYDSIGLKTKPDGGLQYQWLTGDAKEGPFTKIDGATGANYEVTPDAIGKFIQVEVNSTDPNLVGTAKAVTSEAVAVGPWDGSRVDTAWFDNTKASFEIKTPAQLAGLAALVNGEAKGSDGKALAANNMQGKTFTLSNGLDLAGKEWTPIGKTTLQEGATPKNYDEKATDYYFEGTLNGNGNTIKGLSHTAENTVSAGLFGNTKNAAIQSLKLENVNILGHYGVAAVAGYVYDGTTIKDCHVLSGTITGADCAVGGIAGQISNVDEHSSAAITIENCTNAAPVSMKYTDYKAITNTEPYFTKHRGWHFGGIFGSVSTTSTPANSLKTIIRGCTNTGNVTGTQLGGIGSFFYSGPGSSIENCKNTGKLTQPLTAPVSNVGAAGGIITYRNDANTSVKNCVNEGTIYTAGGLGEALSLSIVSGYVQSPKIELIKSLDLEKNATIQPGVTLAILEGQTLTIPADKKLTNDGTIINHGTIVCKGIISGTGSIQGNQPEITQIALNPASDTITGTAGTAITEYDLTKKITVENDAAIGDVTYKVKEGSPLPDGLKLENGKITGTPTAAGKTTSFIEITGRNTTKADLTLNFEIAASNKLYVDASQGDDSHTGYDEANPLKTIEAALEKASATQQTTIYVTGDVNIGSENLYTVTKPVRFTGKDNGNGRLVMKSDLSFDADTVFDNIKLNPNGIRYVYANGHNFEFGEGMEIIPMAEKYNNNLSLYFVAGGLNKTVASTNFTMKSGRISYLFGGGKTTAANADASVTGDTNITITGGYVDDCLVGGGYADAQNSKADVNDTHISIDSSTFNMSYYNNDNSTSEGTIYGGGWALSPNASATVKTTNLTLKNLVDFNASVLGGGHTDSTDGNASVENTNITVDKITTTGSIIGGGMVFNSGNNVDTTQMVTIDIKDSTIPEVFGGGMALSSKTANVANVDIKTENIRLQDNNMRDKIGRFYAGGCSYDGVADAEVGSAIVHINGDFYLGDATAPATNPEIVQYVNMTGYVDSSGQAPITGKAELYINDVLQKLNWAKTADTSWYNGNDTSFTLSSGEQLAGLATLVNDGNDFSGKTIQLSQDIDLDNREWAPIGKSDNPFKGSFDGKDYTVSNLKITSASLNDAGLFGAVSDSEIQNLNIQKADITASERAGALVGSVAGNTTIKKCDAAGGKIQGSLDVGGLAGSAGAGTVFVTCDVTNSTVSAVENGTSQGDPYAGGIVGKATAATVTLTNCTVSGNTVNSYKAGCNGKLVGGPAANWIDGYDLASVFKDSETMTISNEESHIRSFILLLKNENIDSTLGCHVSNCTMPKDPENQISNQTIAIQFDTNDPATLEKARAGIIQRQNTITDEYPSPGGLKRTELTYLIDKNVIYLNYCGHALFLPAYQNENKDCRYDAIIHCPSDPSHTPYIKEMLENYIK